MKNLTWDVTEQDKERNIFILTGHESTKRVLFFILFLTEETQRDLLLCLYYEIYFSTKFEKLKWACELKSKQIGKQTVVMCQQVK